MERDGERRGETERNGGTQRPKESERDEVEILGEERDKPKHWGLSDVDRGALSQTSPPGHCDV